MSRQDRFAACANCIYLDSKHGCSNGIRWISGPVPDSAFCYSAILYRHIDGEAVIYHDAEANRLVVESETTGKFVAVPIGPHGLLKLAKALIGVAMKAEG